MLTATRAIRPDDFELLSQIPGILGVARDQDLRVIWCTRSYCRIAGNNSTIEDMMGTKVEDVVPMEVAQDRIAVHRQVMESGEVMRHFRLMQDTRVVCTVFPLDEQAFGHKGVFVLVQDASVHSVFFADHDIPVMATPNLYKLDPLTARELEVMHLVACGMSTREIAAHLSRAEKTVEHHINSIHGKLGTSSRAQLVRFASERGLQSFTDDEWAQLVAGVRRVRKDASKKELV